MELSRGGNNGQVGQIVIKNPIVRKAVPDDIDGIMDVARSVGNANKVHSTGFLIDDYVKDFDYFKRRFKELITELEHFYVAEEDIILGFLIAYNKDEWLHCTPKWNGDVMWNPGFDIKKTEKYILVDKTAVLSGLTGKGLGSLMYKTLICDIKNNGIVDMFAETIISPKPNFASLEFRIKQNYSLAGIRYEEYKGSILTDLVYHKSV